MKRFSLAAALIAAVAFSAPQFAFAYGQTRGAIMELRLDPPTGKVFVKLSNPVGGSPPSCATGTAYTGTFAMATENAQTFMDLLISARQSGAIVYIRGKDVCTVVGDQEDIGYVVIQEG